MSKKSLIIFSVFSLVTAAVLLLEAGASGGPEESLYRKGIALAAKGDFGQARNEFQEAVRADKSDNSSLGALQVLEDIASKKISREYALRLFESMLSLQNGDIPKAIGILQMSIDLNKDYPKAYNVLGVIYASQADSDKAIASLKKSVEVDRDYAEGYYNLASVYQSLGNNEEAIENFKRYTALRPQAIDGRISLALAYASRQEYDSSIDQCKEAVKIDSGCADAYFNMGLSYFMLDEYMRSRESLLKARELYSQAGDEKGLAAVAQYLDRFTEVENKVKGVLQR